MQQETAVCFQSSLWEAIYRPNFGIWPNQKFDWNFIIRCCMFVSIHHNFIYIRLCQVIWVLCPKLLEILCFPPLQSLEIPFQSYYCRSNCCQPGNCNFLSLGLELLHWVFRQETNLAKRCKLFFYWSLVPKTMYILYCSSPLHVQLLAQNDITFLVSFNLERIKSKLPAENPCMIL